MCVLLYRDLEAVYSLMYIILYYTCASGMIM